MESRVTATDAIFGETERPQSSWDAIVIGAGIAGAATALGLAQRLGRSKKILLVERCAWPRDKVCGGCLNAVGVEALDRLGILTRVRQTGAVPLDAFRLRRGRRECSLRYEPGLGLARTALDASLVESAVQAGVEFNPGCRAVVLPLEQSPGDRCHDHRSKVRRVVLRHGGGEVVSEAAIVIAADGLAGTSLERLRGFEPRIAADSWMGLGATIDHQGTLDAGEVRIYIGDHGYVGLVRLLDSSIHLGAAADPAWVKAVGGPARAACLILGTSGEDWDHAVLGARFYGTPALTRRRNRVAEQGLLVVGDSAGYVEPFTGEGMAWALQSAEEASRLAAATLSGQGEPGRSLAESWQTWQRVNARRRERRIRVLRAVLHRPWLADAAMTLLHLRPIRAAVESELRRRPRPDRHTQAVGCVSAPALGMP
ncbi:FAD-dependent oxidoreductase [soil metagenome]